MVFGVKRRILAKVGGDMDVNHLYTKRWLHDNHDQKFQGFFRANDRLAGGVATLGCMASCVGVAVAVCAGICCLILYAGGRGHLVGDVRSLILKVCYCTLWCVCATVALVAVIGLVRLAVMGFREIGVGAYKSVERTFCEGLSDHERSCQEAVRSFVDGCYEYKCEIDRHALRKRMDPSDSRFYAIYIKRFFDRYAKCVDAILAPTSVQLVAGFLKGVKAGFVGGNGIEVKGWEHMLATIMVAMGDVTVFTAASEHSASDSSIVDRNVAVTKNLALMVMLCKVSIAVLEIVERHEKDDSFMEKLNTACKEYSGKGLNDVTARLTQVWTKGADVHGLASSSWIRKHVLSEFKSEFAMAQQNISGKKVIDEVVSVEQQIGNPLQLKS